MSGNLRSVFRKYVAPTIKMTNVLAIEARRVAKFQGFPRIEDRKPSMMPAIGFKPRIHWYFTGTKVTG
jgi:hypothetical protein